MHSERWNTLQLAIWILPRFLSFFIRAPSKKLGTAALSIRIRIRSVLVELGLVESRLIGRESCAGAAGVKFDPDFVSLLVDVPGRVKGVSRLVLNDVFLGGDFALSLLRLPGGENWKSWSSEDGGSALRIQTPRSGC